jgi:hypothetical protein
MRRVLARLPTGPSAPPAAGADETRTDFSLYGSIRH